jgi:hypothetical protein
VLCCCCQELSAAGLKVLSEKGMTEGDLTDDRRKIDIPSRKGMGL